MIGFREMLAENGYSDRPFIIAEIGVAIGTRDPEKVRAFMEHVMDFAAASDPKIGCTADSGRLIQRLSLFTAHSLPAWQRLLYLGFGALVIHPAASSLFRQDGQLTDLGVAYARRVAVEDAR